MIGIYVFGLFFVLSLVVPFLMGYPGDDLVYKYVRALPAVLVASVIAGALAFRIPKDQRSIPSAYFLPTVGGLVFIALMVWSRHS